MAKVSGSSVEIADYRNRWTGCDAAILSRDGAVENNERADGERGAGSPAGARFLLLVERLYHARTAPSQPRPHSCGDTVEYDHVKMLKTFFYLLTLNVIYFGFVAAITDFGFEYHKAHKLYPETLRISYDATIGGVYGQRWIRFFEYAVWFGVIADLVLCYIWYRRKQIAGKDDLSIKLL
jgi:hypothetical protein